MTKKSIFLKSAKLAIAGVVLTTGLSSCSIFGAKHKCAGKDDVKVEKAGCSAKNTCSATTAKEEKAKCSAKNSCSAKKAKAKCSSAKKTK